MPKKVIMINKTNQAKIQKWINTYLPEGRIKNHDFFIKTLENHLLEEIKTHKDCTEKSIIQAYLDVIPASLTMIPHGGIINDDFLLGPTKAARRILASKYTSNMNFTNNIDIYFNDVKREYIMHPMNESDSLEFLPENKEVFIKNNLKLVVTCAKKYRNLGIPFEDLIQAGNYGLLVAFNKFDTSRSNLRNAIIKNIEESEKESFTYNDAILLIEKSFSYNKDLERTIKLIPQEGFISQEQFKKWVLTNVKTAVFASVAFQWIRAYILLDLSQYASAVKIPKVNIKKEITEDEMITGIYQDQSIPSVVSLDAINPHTENSFHDRQISSAANEEFLTEDNAIDIKDNEILFSSIISKAISELNDMSKRIIKKKFGIGYPTELSINDIAESEGIAVNRVKHIIQVAMKEMRKNISEEDRELLEDIF